MVNCIYLNKYYYGEFCVYCAPFFADDEVKVKSGSTAMIAVYVVVPIAALIIIIVIVVVVCRRTSMYTVITKI